jgi:GSCFA family.
MEFRTEQKILTMEHLIVYGDGMLFLGSCFADEVGGICRGLGFDALVNPFGVLFNPASIAQSLHRLSNKQAFSMNEIVKVGEEYYTTFSHNSDFWMQSPEKALEKANAALIEASEHFLKSKWVVISLGTAWVYRHKQRNQIVSNCHKLPSSEFERSLMSVEECVSALSDVIDLFPEKNFIFTVSPLRHLKDGLHGNQISKATLLLAVEKICNDFDNAFYFPAYEIMMDELRDYRFYKEDMMHPTEQAVHYIWEKFIAFGIDKNETGAMKMAAELKSMIHHKPLHPESSVFKKFEELREAKQKELQRHFKKVKIENL